MLINEKKNEDHDIEHEHSTSISVVLVHFEVNHFLQVKQYQVTSLSIG